jgi:hypothetical protein
MADDPTDPYASERSAPTLPACGASAITLKFDGENLWMYGLKYLETPRSCSAVSGPIKYPAVSGAPLEGKFVYTVQRQSQKNEGPIPEGRYWITPREIWEGGIINWLIGREIGWGKFRITIHPFPTTKTYGRGGFFIHGGADPGSIGCIDLTWHIDRFIQNLRGAVKETDCYLPLTVDYSTPGH